MKPAEAKIQNWRSPAEPDARTHTVSNLEKQQARRVLHDGRVLVLPPEGYGDRWSGGGSA